MHCIIACVAKVAPVIPITCARRGRDFCCRCLCIPKVAPVLAFTTSPCCGGLLSNLRGLESVPAERVF